MLMESEFDRPSQTEDKYKELIKITETAPRSVATVAIVVKNFPPKPKDKNAQDRQTEELVTVFITTLTQALLVSQNNGKNTFDVMVDCKDTSSKHVNYKFGKSFIALAKKVFDGNLGRCVIFNTGNLFKTVYKVISPLIDKPTREKIKIF